MTVNGKSGNHGDDGDCFLECLPLTRYTYTGKQQFLDIFYREFIRLQQDTTGQISECFLFEIDENTFNRDFLYTSDRHTIRLWGSFSASEKLVLIKMVTAEHSNAATVLHDEIRDALRSMNLHNALTTFSGTTVKGHEKAKQGDHGWGPRRPPRGRSRRWPTVALEVAVSESQAKLNSDVRFWLRESAGETQIALTLRVNRTAPVITIEKWKLKNDRIHRSHRITISKRGNGQISVQDGPLIIEFHKLFCRAPSTPRETDVILGQASLESIASTIWSAQGLED